MNQIEAFRGIAVTDKKRQTSYKQIDEIDWTNRANRPVTATFERYSDEVHTYTFVNSKTEKKSQINSTPNHPFYVKNKRAYIPIGDTGSSDEFYAYNSGWVTKIIKSPRASLHSKIPEKVYNVEVYQEHRYYVNNSGGTGLLVHNDYIDKYPNTIFDAFSLLPTLEKGIKHLPEKTKNGIYQDLRKYELAITAYRNQSNYINLLFDKQVGGDVNSLQYKRNPRKFSLEVAEGLHSKHQDLGSEAIGLGKYVASRIRLSLSEFYTANKQSHVYAQLIHRLEPTLTNLGNVWREADDVALVKIINCVIFERNRRRASMNNM
jgi:hypothetical protein